MPAKFTTKWTLEYDRRGPLVTRGAGAGLPRVEGTANVVLNALATNLSLMPEAAASAGEDIVREYTERHNELASDMANSNFQGSPAGRSGPSLRASFRTEYEKGQGKFVGRSLNTARHAIFQELGFHHWNGRQWVSPKPFMFNTYASLKEGFINAVRGIFG